MTPLLAKRMSLHPLRTLIKPRTYSLFPCSLSWNLKVSMKSNRLGGAMATHHRRAALPGSRCTIAHSLSVLKCFATTTRRTTMSFVEGADRDEATRADAKVGAASPYRTMAHRFATNRPPPRAPGTICVVESAIGKSNS